MRQSCISSFYAGLSWGSENEFSIIQSPAIGSVLAPGVYDVVFTTEDDSGNPQTYSFVLTVDLLLGANTLILESEISLYPNPVSETLSISVQSTFNYNKTELYSVSGQN